MCVTSQQNLQRNTPRIQLKSQSAVSASPARQVHSQQAPQGAYQHIEWPEMPVASIGYLTIEFLSFMPCRNSSVSGFNATYISASSSVYIKEIVPPQVAISQVSAPVAKLISGGRVLSQILVKISHLRS